MSIKVMSQVWDKSRHKGSELLLLIAIADNAADDGFCWPGQVYLAGKIRMDKSSVIRLTKKLEASGELFVARSRRKGNKYIVKSGMSDGQFLNVLAARLPHEHARYEAINAISCILLCCKLQLQKSQLATTEVASMQHEPSVTVNEPSHGADAPTQPFAEINGRVMQGSPVEKSGDELLDEYFEPQQEKESAPVTPHWTKRIAEDWTAWGAESEEMQRQLAAFGERGRTVQRLGYELERQFRLHPLWRKKSDVKSWMSGLAACLELAEGDEKIVTRAARELIDGGMTVADPWSLRKQTRAIVAEMTRQATTDREYIV